MSMKAKSAFAAFPSKFVNNRLIIVKSWHIIQP